VQAAVPAAVVQDNQELQVPVHQVREITAGQDQVEIFVEVVVVVQVQAAGQEQTAMFPGTVVLVQHHQSLVLL
jgi:hypothetical protein